MKAIIDALKRRHGAERLFGYSADEAVGQSVIILIPPIGRMKNS